MNDKMSKENEAVASWKLPEQWLRLNFDVGKTPHHPAVGLNAAAEDAAAERSRQLGKNGKRR
jgi:hypothetical protein